MSEEIKQIAMRIHELREIAGLSVETVARDFEITADVYRNFESGDVDIPVSFLHKVAQKFGVELSTLLTGQNPRLHIYSLVRKGKGMDVDRGKRYKHQSLGYNFIHKKAEPFLVTVNPEPENTSLTYNAHPGQEFHYLLAGRLKVIIDEHELYMEEGDSLIFDSTFKHAMQALDGRPAQFLAIIL